MACDSRMYGEAYCSFRCHDRSCPRRIGLRRRQCAGGAGKTARRRFLPGRDRRCVQQSASCGADALPGSQRAGGYRAARRRHEQRIGREAGGDHRHSRYRAEFRDMAAIAKAQERSSPRAEETESSTETQPRSAPAATAQTPSEITESASGPPATGSEGTRPVSTPPATGRTSSETAKPASAPAVRPAPVSDTGSSGDGDISTERLRDYLGAFVLAGLDQHVGSEADFFADRVKYYDQGVIDREKIRNDLQAYAARWPERHFWFVGNIIIEPQHRKRVRVTFPLRYELRNGATYSTGTINKTLVLEPVGDDLQIVAVSESKAE